MVSRHWILIQQWPIIKEFIRMVFLHLVLNQRFRSKGEWPRIPWSPGDQKNSTDEMLDSFIFISRIIHYIQKDEHNSCTLRFTFPHSREESLWIHEMLDPLYIHLCYSIRVLTDWGVSNTFPEVTKKYRIYVYDKKVNENSHNQMDAFYYTVHVSRRHNKYQYHI